MKQALYLFLLIFCGIRLSAQTVTIYRSGTALSPAYTSIKSAVAASIDKDSLVLSADTFHEHMISIDKSLSMTGTINIASRTVIDALSDSTAILLINPSLSSVPVLLLRDISITNGYARNGILKGGGAICADASTLLVLDGQTLLYRNKTDPAAALGGAIYSDGQIKIKGHSRIYSNTANGSGGGIYCNSDLGLYDYARVDSNQSGDAGGGIFVKGITELRDSATIVGNSAKTGAGICVSNEQLILTNKSSIRGNHAINYGAGIVLLNSNLFMSDSALIAFNVTDSNYGAGIYAKGNNDIYIDGGQLIGNHSSDTAKGLGMAVYNDNAIGGSSIVSITSARIFNPRSDNSRQNEVYNAHAFSAFISDSTWWGESDTSHLIYNTTGATVAMRTWVVAEWSVNNDVPVTSLTSFPVEGYFRLNTGGSLAPKMFWMLQGLFSADSGTFSPTIAAMASTNIVGSVYSIPWLSRLAKLQASVDADTFRKTVYVVGLNISEQKGSSSLRIYPNPSQGDITIEQTSAMNNESRRIAVKDMLGRIVYRQTANFTNGKSFLHIDAPTGTYLLEMQAADGNIYQAKISLSNN